MTDEQKIGTGDGEYMECLRCGTLAVFIGSHWTHSEDQCITKLVVLLDGAKATLRRTGGLQGHDEPCAMCGKPCNGLAGNPSEWPIPLVPLDGEPGVAKWHHIGCVHEKLAETDRAHREVSQLVSAVLEAWRVKNVEPLGRIIVTAPDGFPSVDLTKAQ